MHSNHALIDGFYRAFSQRDDVAMARCYAPDAVFEDPVFTRLVGDEIGSMWSMLCRRGEDLQISWEDVRADEDSGSARWEARYTFSPTGRAVHNVITATFELRDGLITGHHDHFDFYRWSRMALGPLGVALGWTPLVRERVRKQARTQLERYRTEKS